MNPLLELQPQPYRHPSCFLPRLLVLLPRRQLLGPRASAWLPALVLHSRLCERRANTKARVVKPKHVAPGDARNGFARMQKMP